MPGIGAGLAQRTPLTQQIPALVELDLHVRQPIVVGIASRTFLEQLVLFGDEVLDMFEHLVFRLALR